MALEAQNNPYPSILIAEHADPESIPDANPAAGYKRLVVKDDLTLWLLDDAGTATEVGGGGSGDITTDTAWAAKGDLIAGTGADAAAILTVGANDTILMADSGQSTGLKWVASQTPSTQAFSDSAAEGTADTYARGDHVHGMPADPGAGSGGLVLLESHTASTSASLDFTAFISSTYDEYLFELINVDVATDAVNFNCFVGTGGGPTYDTATTNYGFSAFRQVFNGTGNAGAATNAGWALTGGDTMDNGASSGVCGWIRLFDPGSASLNKRMQGQVSYVLNSSNGYLNCLFSGSYHSATALTAIQFKPSSGNIDAGTIRVYGVAK